MTTVRTSRVADPDLLDALRERFAQSCTHEVVEAAEQCWSDELWHDVVADGFAGVGVPEGAGGSGGTAVEACAVLRAAGAYAVPLPLAESGLLAGWIAARTGELPTGVVTVAPPRRIPPIEQVDADTALLRGRLVRVPWARNADHVLVLVDAGRAVAVVPRELLTIQPGANLAGEPRDTIEFADAPVPIHRLTAAADPDELYRWGALSRAALIAGALQRTAELTVRYTSERCQFGRPVARFQAVQQHLVTLAEVSALTTMAVEVAAAAVAGGRGAHESAAAKIVAGQSAVAAARAAHQAHGAMGVTREYPLHQLTRRLNAWSREYGSERHWAAVLGREVVDRGADALYPFITDPSQGEELSE